MAISNTKILIKRSSTTTIPTGLQAGELAYSFASNTLFLGNTTGTGVVNIGGYLYTSTIDAATAANTSSTLVKRGSDGSFAGQLYGTANLAVALSNPQNFSISGGDITATAQSFQGNNAVTLSASLNSISGLTGGTYGSTTSVPVLGIAANGRVMNVTTATIATSLFVAGNTGVATQSGGNTLTISGNTGIVTTVTSNTNGANVVISTDNTVMRTNTSTVGTQVVNTNVTVTRDLTVQGNVTVLGNSFSISVTNLNVDDSLIYLANGNYSSDAVDIGFIGHYNDGTNAHAGFIRDPNLKEFIVFQGYTPEVVGNNLINIAHPSFAYSNLYVNTVKGNIQSNTANIINTTVSGTANIVTLGVSGITNLASLGATTANITGLTATNQTVTGTSNIATLGVSGVANIASLGVGTNANIAALTVINTANIATLGVSGITNLASLGATTANISALTVINTANIATLGVSGIANISTLGAASANIGTLTLTNALLVGSGGTGLQTATQYGVTYGNGTGAFGVTAAAGTADQTFSNQILTVTNAGVPIWSTTMDGGQF
jgi:hypothetical protein